MTEVRSRYLCWCDGEPTCDGEADEPFGLCAECRRFRHGRLPSDGLTPEDVLLAPQPYGDQDGQR